MRTLLAGVAVLWLAMPQAAHALTISTGEDLQKACKTTEHFSECVSFLAVVYGTAKVIARMSDPGSKGIIGSCGPDKGIDTVPLAIALRLAWQEHADKHPRKLGNLAIREALLAFEERWPCQG